MDAVALDVNCQPVFTRFPAAYGITRDGMFRFSKILVTDMSPLGLSLISYRRHFFDADTPFHLVQYSAR